MDVVGVGANSVDYVYSLPGFPQPDSPSSKLRITRHLLSCGGQTTTALATCAAMGLRTAYIGAVGDDDNGRRMLDELERRGIDVSHISVRETVNPYAVILLDEREGERVVLWDRDPRLRLLSADIDGSVIAAARLLHVDDADEDAAIEAARMGRDAGIHVTSDIERVTERTEELVAAVTIPIFAEHVLEPLTGERDFERALRKVYSRLKPASTTHKASKPVSSTVRLKPDTTHEATYEEGLICVTLGARGAMLLAGETLHVAPGLPLDVIDTTGAGDIFRGAFITSLLRGDAPGDILRFANAAAAISCTRLGAMASVPTTEETDALATKDTKIAKDAKNTDV